MIRKHLRNIALAAALLAAPSVALASTLEMQPVMLKVLAPDAASTINLKNTGTDPINAQVRVFKWTQGGGKDKLAATRDVVASPPAIKLAPGKSTVIRVVRLNKAPIAGEETYRLLIDEVPKPPKAAKVGVGISLRYSVPVFFAAADASADLKWQASVSGGKLRISAANAGTMHVRLADLSISAKGKTINVAPGLAGYVLGNSANAWAVKAGGISAGQTIKIIAKGDNGAVEATVPVVAGN